MGSRLIEIVGVLLFVSVLGLTCLQSFWHPFPESMVYGVSEKQPTPVLSWKSWQESKFQKQFDAWLADRIGFKAFWVRTENQINFSLNRRITPMNQKSGTQIVLGKENWLYEKSYVKAYLGKRKLISKRKIKGAVSAIQKLQTRLTKRGIAFLLVISPSKAATYPEYLPERITKPIGALPPETNYQRTRAILKAYRIAQVDSAALFRQLKTQSDYALFAKGGTHWNHYSATKVLEAMVQSLNPRMDRATMPLPTIRAVELTRPRGADADLGNLINIWTPRATEAPTPYPQFEAMAGADQPRPRILMVGSSFVWTLIDQMNQANLYEEIDFLYYYKRRIAYPGAKDIEFKRTKADWENLLKDKDAVIMEINEAALPHFNSRFIKDALRHLKRTSKGE